MPDPKLRAIVERMVAAGEPEENIALVIQHYKPATTALEPQDTLGHYGAYKRIGDAAISAGRTAINHPVQSLAMLGALAAVPLTGGASVPAAIAASGLGAAGGAGLGSIVNAARGGENGPQTAAGVARTMGTEGALGAAGEGIGQGISKILRVGGKLVYKAALRPSMQAQREFGDVAATGLRERVPVSAGGAETAERLLTESGDKAKALVAEAKAAGAGPLRIRGIVQSGEVKGIAQRAGLRAKSGLPDETPAIAGRVRAMRAQNPHGMDIEDAQAMKGELQDLASRVYRAQDKGTPVLDLSADTNAALARGLRSEIGTAADAVGVPGVHAANARTQDLIGLTRSVEDATRRNVPAVGSLRTFLGDFIPSLSSRGGILADRVGRSGALPISLKAALIAALGGEN